MYYILHLLLVRYTKDLATDSKNQRYLFRLVVSDEIMSLHS
jgi:hypothetical protein